MLAELEDARREIAELRALQGPAEDCAGGSQSDAERLAAAQVRRLRTGVGATVADRVCEASPAVAALDDGADTCLDRGGGVEASNPAGTRADAVEARVGRCDFATSMSPQHRRSVRQAEIRALKDTIQEVARGAKTLLQATAAVGGR